MDYKKYLEEAKKMMGKNFIGPVELAKIADRFSVKAPFVLPKYFIPISILKKYRKDHVLILGVSKDKHGKKLTLAKLRDFFGFDPLVSEPCFYNQDWYLKEKFATEVCLKPQWYLLKKEVISKTRAKELLIIKKTLAKNEQFPSAVLTAFTFFAYYLLNREMLWKYDFIWCSDKDHNGDRIYVGRYLDPKKINKNGFNIHRYLTLRPVYGLAPEIIL